MKKIILPLLAFCCCISTFAQNNKNLIIGNWQIERCEMEGKETFNRSNNAAVFATLKSMTFGDITALSEADSLSLLEAIREIENDLGSLSVSFDKKGNHITRTLDEKTKKMKASESIYKFAPNDDTKLMIKEGEPSNPFDTYMILELTATTLTISQSTESLDTQSLKMTFKRMPDAAVKKQ